MEKEEEKEINIWYDVINIFDNLRDLVVYSGFF